MPQAWMVAVLFLLELIHPANSKEHTRKANIITLQQRFSGLFCNPHTVTRRSRIGRKLSDALERAITGWLQDSDLLEAVAGQHLIGNPTAEGRVKPCWDWALQWSPRVSPRYPFTYLCVTSANSKKHRSRNYGYTLQKHFMLLSHP